MLSNQGLETDKIYNETAARFNGMKDAGAAKIELVIRVIAETGIRDLFEGIAWTVSHFQSTPDEIMVLGKQLTVNPARWWTEHAVEAKVGAGADQLIDQMVLHVLAPVIVGYGTAQIGRKEFKPATDGVFDGLCAQVLELAQAGIPSRTLYQNL